MAGRDHQLKVLGAVLAGGQARRFGSDKAMAEIDGQALIDHVIAGLYPQVDGLVIVGREHATLPNVQDRPGPGEGPLGGLCAALFYARDNGYNAVLSMGCDTLPVPPDLALALVKRTRLPCVVAGQWLIGLWPTDLADALEAWLRDQSGRSIRGWMAQVNAVEVELPYAFGNINTPDDLTAYLALMGQ